MGRVAGGDILLPLMQLIVSQDGNLVILVFRAAQLLKHAIAICHPVLHMTLRFRGPLAAT